jgi:hypothetical protein
LLNFTLLFKSLLIWAGRFHYLPKFKNYKKEKKQMKLLTKELLERFNQIGRQEEVKDPLVVAKFFNPTGAGTWYATEYEPESKMFFGYVSIFGDWNDEWGYFSLEELESLKGPFGLGIERDIYFVSKPFSQIKN